MTEAVEIVAAADVPRELVRRAFNAGFEGYVVPVNLNDTQFDGMIASEEIDLSASLIARNRRGEPAGIALLAIRGDECWCGGLGVVPRSRRAGIGRRLMERLMAEGSVRGLARMRLEVINGNDAARALYDQLGFVPWRRLDLFQGEPTTVAPVEGDVVELADLETVWSDFTAYHPVAPPWQRDLASLRLARQSLQPVGFGLGPLSRPDAYVLTIVANGAIRIVDSGTRQSVGEPVETMSGLVNALARRFPGHAIVSVNVPEDDPLNGALRALGVPIPLTQTELVREFATHR